MSIKKSVDRLIEQNTNLRTANNLYHRGVIRREVLAAFRQRLRCQLILEERSWDIDPDKITAVG